jgi:hypothetical protein
VIDPSRRRRSLLVPHQHPSGQPSPLSLRRISRTELDKETSHATKPPEISLNKETALSGPNRSHVSRSQPILIPPSPTRSRPRPYAAFRQRRQKRALLSILENTLSSRPPPPTFHRNTRRHHILATETASQQFLLFSVAAPSIPIQHAQ